MRTGGSNRSRSRCRELGCDAPPASASATQASETAAVRRPRVALRSRSGRSLIASLPVLIRLRGRRVSLGVLRAVRHDTVAEGPVLLGNFDEIDEDVLPADARFPRQPVGDGAVESALLLERPAQVQCDLNEDDVLSPLDPEVAAIGDEGLARVFLDDLKAIVRRH